MYVTITTATNYATISISDEVSDEVEVNERLVMPEKLSNYQLQCIYLIVHTDYTN